MQDFSAFVFERTDRMMAMAHSDALIVSLPESVEYFSGFFPIGSSILYSTETYFLYCPQSGEKALITSAADVPTVLELKCDCRLFVFGTFHFDFTETDSFSDQVQTLTNVRYDSAASALSSAVRDLCAGCHSVYADPSRMPVTTWRTVEKLCGITLTPASDLIRSIKKVKHPQEVEWLRQSAHIAEKALGDVIKHISFGTSEADMERIFQSSAASEGAYAYFFVASVDERSAYVDTYCSPDQRVRDGSVIRFDFGCIYHGYRSDFARTAIVGSNDKAERYYEATRKGCEKAIAALRPGVKACDIFKIAVLETRAAGIPHYQRNHCGHGIGQAIYDFPSIAENCETIIEEGMVLCIETPYYEVGWGGVQTEDTVLVTSDGPVYLTETSRDLIRIR